MNEFIELTADSADESRLLRLYDELLCACFPDENERESIENIRKYLDLKRSGWYLDSNYHVLVWEKDGQIVGGSVSYYLAAPNSGVIEFLAIAPEWRRQRLSTALFTATEAIIHKDALCAFGRKADWLFCEIDVPAAPSHHGETAETRARIWAGWGFRYVDIGYLQPALDPHKTFVRHLKLLAKPSGVAPQDEMAGTLLTSVLHEYMRLAMRINTPSDSAEFKSMAEEISLRERIPILQVTY